MLNAQTRRESDVSTSCVEDNRTAGLDTAESVHGRRTGTPLPPVGSRTLGVMIIPDF